MKTSINSEQFINATHAFEYYYDKILLEGEEYINTKALFEVGFTIKNPEDNVITTPWRNFNEEYASFEWQWYLSGDPSAKEIEKRAKIWSRMYDPTDPDKRVNSNYGHQWKRNNQLNKVINLLKKDIFSRRAVISIYDGKEIDRYAYDTPCTTSITFYVRPSSINKLNMSVKMRSNHLTFGFCNDQYFFSNLQKMVANSLSLEVGYYYHHADNLHLYSYDFEKKNTWEKENLSLHNPNKTS
jgi:thymidylate synthase